MRPASFFKDTLTDSKTAHSKSPSDNSFTRAYGMPAFEYYQHVRGLLLSHPSCEADTPNRLVQ